MFAAVAASAMTQLDASIVYVALPHIADDLGVDVTGLQWVLTGYLLTLASLILLGGALGDRFGRRRIFGIGTVWFMLASALCGIAPNLLILVLARMLQGVGGALLTPGSLALIQASFRQDDRAPAVGLWSGFGGVAGAIGPFLGGWLVDGPGWRWAFLLNVPLGIAVIVAQRAFPESRDPHLVPGFDVSGASVVGLGLVGMTWALNEAGERGWSDPVVFVPLVVGVAALVGVPAHRAAFTASARSPDPVQVADVLGPEHLDVRALRRTRRRVLLRRLPAPGRGRMERHPGRFRVAARHDPDAVRIRLIGTDLHADRSQAAVGRRAAARRRRGAAVEPDRRRCHVVDGAARGTGVRHGSRDVRRAR